MLIDLTTIDTKNVEQGSDLWKQIRLGHVTASNMADVMSKGKEGKESLKRPSPPDCNRNRFQGCDTTTPTRTPHQIRQPCRHMRCWQTLFGHGDLRSYSKRFRV